MDKFDNFFAKGLDKLQKVVEEYPQKQSPGSSSHQVLSEGGVLKAWQQFNLAPRKAVLIETLNSLQSGQGDFDVAPLLEVAEHLSNLPDPVLHLERAQAIELEIKELKDKNSKLQKQAEHNQLDNAEVNKLIEQSKRLETERAEFKTQMEAKDQKMCELESKLKEVQERDLGVKDLEQELIRTKSHFRELQGKYEESQALIFEINSKKEVDQVGQSTETETLLQEMEALRERTTQLAHENEQLKNRLESSPTSDPSEISQLRTEIEDLTKQIQLKNSKIQELDDRFNSQSLQEEFSAQIDEQQFMISELKRKIQVLPSIEQHQAAVERVRELQALVDVQIEKEGWESKQEVSSSQGAQMELVETLRERNRALSDEAVQLRRDLEKLNADLSAANNESQNFKETIDRKQGLISELEKQLADVTQGFTGDEMLGIISHQRDRFRERVQKLEDQLEVSNQKVREGDVKFDKMQKDNVELVEKVRYLEHYRKQKQPFVVAGNPKVIRVDDLGVASEGGDLGSRYDCGPFQIGVKGGGPSGGLRSRGSRNNCWGGGEQATDQEMGELEARYSQAYEDKLNPFTKFQSNEVQKRMEKMQITDRAVLSGSQMLLTSRSARIFVVTYTVLLHLFIMTLLYIAISPRAVAFHGVVDDNGLTEMEQKSVAAYLHYNQTNQTTYNDTT
eukprot:TRINITY_DN9179_c0_g1_i5.p1 TRINITY_DN9179_c0_g1~~TRINITY_DN9179_c0_g1_i5.p1  ORF type:complete len:677 (+),score=137.55 TRINITY_DN9179_c0_g1_i5:24-2054(+)